MVVFNLGLSQLIPDCTGAIRHLSAVYRTGCIKFYPHHGGIIRPA